MATLDFDKDRVRLIRARLKMDQREFAEYLKVSIATVRAWEQGTAKPYKLKIVGRLLEAEEAGK